MGKRLDRARYAGKEREPFYGTGVWRRLRARILQRDHYWCRNCNKRSAFIVHHVKPRKEYPELALVEENLISVCGKCHEELEKRAMKAAKHTPQSPAGVRIETV